MSTYEHFEKLCKMRGITPYQVSKNTGIATSTLSEWKQGKYEPKMEKLQKIADFFNVSVEFLTTGKVFSDSVYRELEYPEYYYADKDSRDIANFLFENPEYKTLFSAVRDIPPEDLKLVQDMIARLTRKTQ